jgi:hypothetical protein
LLARQHRPRQQSPLMLPDRSDGRAAR